MRPEDLCAKPETVPRLTTVPHAAPIFLSSVYRCADPRQADRILGKEAPGYVYSRDGHPNGDALAEKCRELHGAERAIICGSGMSALSAALLSTAMSGDHIVASRWLYGKSLTLLAQEAPRLGVTCDVVDTTDLAATALACKPHTRLIVVETLSNPLLRVADLPGLAQIAHQHGAALLVDNSFASPVMCRPLEWGADFVLESLTKIMNGHSDVLLGLLCGPKNRWERVPGVVSAWGLSAPPFDCWLAARGLLTLGLRAERAFANALHVAEFLAGRPEVEAVHYPGLPGHPDHALAARIGHGRFGSIVTFTLVGGTATASRFIHSTPEIPFCPSLGELSTTVSHPESTSHRGLTSEARAAMQIFGGTLRLSVGIESLESLYETLSRGLHAAC